MNETQTETVSMTAVPASTPRIPAWATNLPAALRGWRSQPAYIDAAHRVHARVEDRNGKDCGIGRFPSHNFAINSAWLAAPDRRHPDRRRGLGDGQGAFLQRPGCLRLPQGVQDRGEVAQAGGDGGVAGPVGGIGSAMPLRGFLGRVHWTRPVMMASTRPYTATPICSPVHSRFSRRRCSRGYLP